jgi:transcriptional regulator with XRE-family HTH domain
VKREVSGRSENAAMASRSRAVSLGTARGEAALAAVIREFDQGRRDRGLTCAEVGRAVGLSPSQVSRISRGRSPDLSIVQAARLLAVVGLELSARAYPTGEPIRDAAHLALVAAFRARVHPSLRWRTEVPLPIPGDLRSWDVRIDGRGWAAGVEMETRPIDIQALQRRTALKQRDGEVERLIVVLSDTRHNRHLVRAHADSLVTQFPVPGTRSLERLGAGADPGGNSIILLASRRG